MAIVQLDLEENVIRRFNSALQAKRETGISNSSISHVLRGNRETAGGFFWRYAAGTAKKSDRAKTFCQSCSEVLGREKFLVCLKCLNRGKRRK